MTGGKISRGDIWRVPPADDWNNALDAGAAYAAGKLQRTGQQILLPTPTDIVQVRNDTGQDMARGEVLCLDSFILTDLDPEYLWFAGVLPASSEAPPDSKPYGVLLEPIPHQASGDQLFGRLQLSGNCFAMINNVSSDHPYAHIVSGQKQLATNASHGQVQILHRQDVGGQWWASVRLSNYRSAGGCDYIDFEIIAVGTNALGIRWANVTIQARTCGCDTVPEEVSGEIAKVYDLKGCFLNEPDADLVGRLGSAKYVQDIRFISSPIEPGNDVPDCTWSIHSLCCPTCEVV